MQINQIFILILVILASGVIGSFLNMLIYRLPNFANEQSGSSFFNLIKHISIPRSHCDNCNEILNPRMLIPIFSFIKQQGVCSFCGKKIGFQVFLVELITIFLGVFLYFSDFSLQQKITLMIFFSLGIVLSCIDFKHKILPDEITLLLVWLGLFFNLNNTFVNINDAVLGAILGYVSLWSLYQIYYLLRKKEGLGYGDFKLFAAIGSWFGFQTLSIILLVSGILGLIFAVIKKENSIIAFGPFLIVATFIVLILVNFSWLNLI